ncbi:helix-turn-helix domain-containing protein [Gordonibacter massiliensis (ex Traore et al. 2017)]|uniref:Helix-turn-helix domain-containing protein n=1 Tax=Gordonibacter massiliensis (ex Traore et al. 2017) TaxID=1841863 RepID=A0A842JCB6_9ACTN|nr:helix-turn-helix domain-containing protein [Gordonibacter massiliensis (ex Traore et al. 2017)]MBC2888141.1 helix-turn-helix domain-containing protein [Gordonibacter massiliensis (ex Traore et al. 2017)]
MGDTYEFSFEEVLKRHRATTKDLVDSQVITQKEAELIDSRKVKAVRLSSLSKICAALGCSPGDIFVVSPENKLDRSSERKL